MILGSCHASGLLAAMPRLVQAPLLAGKGSFLPMLLLLLAAHSLADYPLQGSFLSEGKNRKKTPYGAWCPWYHLMASHAIIHSGFVLLITGSLYCAIAEAVIHFCTDTLKCEGKISNRTDQLSHVACKVLWAALATWTVIP